MASLQHRVRAFVVLIYAAGLMCLVAGMHPWHSTDLVQFACYLVLTAIASGIVLISAILVTGEAHTLVTQIVGFIAVVFGSLNAFGGFVVTDRMLEMFHARPGGRS